MRKAQFASFVALGILTTSFANAQDTMFLHQPHISQGTIAFTYHGDIWLADEDGGNPRRLTNHVANDSRPRISPDGRRVAFSSNRMGNDDIWVVPIGGGEPQQLTFNTTGDTLSNWTPDGQRLIFASSRAPHPFLNPLYTVALDGSIPLPMDMDTGARGMIRQDGSMLAFNRVAMSTTRKGYRGNRQADIWVQDLNSKEIRQLTDANPQEHRSHVHDGEPMWGADGMIYFVSERGGTFNIWKISPDGGEPIQVTRHEKDGVQGPSISADGNTIIYENGFTLWKLAIADGEPQKISVNLVFEPKENLIRFLTAENTADAFTPSPDGEHLAVDYHGEIFLVPSDPETGEKTQVTSSPWRDRYQAFSPDGTKLAYITDATLEEELWVYDLASGEHRQVSAHQSTKRRLLWSPDSKQIVFVGGNDLVQVEVASGQNLRIGRLPGGYNVTQFSADGRWLVYSSSDVDRNSEVFLYDIQNTREHNVTQHLARERNGQLTPDGKTVLFTSNRSGTDQLYAVSLQQLTSDPEDPLNKKPDQPAEDTEVAGAAEIRIDTDEIDRRAVALTGANAAVTGYFLSADGKTVYYASNDDGRALFAVNLDGSGRRKIADGAFNGMTPTADRKTVFFREGDRIQRMSLTGAKKEPIAFSLRVKVDQRAEWEQIFEEAWRSMKYRFYDQNMHGFDWEAIKAEYKPLLAYVGSNEDVNQLANEMIGELNASHVGVRGAPSHPMEALYTTRSLGFELRPDGGHYRVSHVYRDGPADKEWIDLIPGDYVLAIDNQEVRYPDNYWKILNNTINDYVPIRVSDQPDGETREVRIRGIDSLRNIKYREWVHGNQKFVEQETQGQIAYVHIRSMNQASLRQFRQEVDQYWNAKGMIIDIRYNGGGNIDEPLLDILERVPYAYVNQRWGDRAWGRRHRQAIAGPKVMMINNRSGSDAEMTPMGFRTLGLGQLVGTPTAAGVIWTGSYGLMNGGSIRTPGSLAVTYDATQPNNYGINLENYGVEPDVWVENTPADELRGYDRELKAAVDEALRMLEAGGYQFAPDRRENRDR